MSDDPHFRPLFPDVKHPYYIVAPSYERTSAGVRVQHLHCHSLNLQGQTAYILLYPSLPWKKTHTAPDLLTPILTPEIMQDHFHRGLTPIVVYPEILKGNPFNAPCVVRHVLNFPGLLGGDKTYAPDELCFGYSKSLAEAAGAPDNVLFLPATDTRIFKPAAPDQKRQGTCFYGYKYQNAYKGELFETTKNSVEITRDKPDSPTAEEIAALFQTSELFYAYENTSLSLEAVLCGCPAVMLPNPYFTELIAINELGKEGYAWGTTADEIAWAKVTVEQGRKNYLKTFDTYWRDLERFISLTQQHAEGRPYRQPIRMPRFWETFLLGFRRRGLVGAMRKLFRTLMAKD